ncbi:glycosyltransferase family 2 protein [Megasphaera sueciensis]|uniref:glycosyltransferase family 2 protein n=1 Tax=Megasphaera sueciensis TaxID=349094 RepID=UPI003D0191A3
MSNVKVSVLVPIYNVEKYLPECLDSLKQQTLKEIEFICLDDGSTDSCSNILDKYADNDKRFVVVHKKNSGYGDTLNKGLNIAQGEYIGIVESDDFAASNMFEELYGFAKKFNVNIVKSLHYLYWDNKNVFPFDDMPFSVPRNKIIDPLINTDIFMIGATIWDSIYKSSFLRSENICFLTTPGASYQDTSFNFKALSKSGPIYFTSNRYLYYRQDNPQSSVKSVSMKKVMSNHIEFLEIEKFLNNNPSIERKVLDIYKKRKIKILIGNVLKIYDINEKMKYVSKISEEFKCCYQLYGFTYLNKKYQFLYFLVMHKVKYGFMIYDGLRKLRW